MHSLEAGSAWKHDSIYPCPVPHQYGPVPYWCMVILLNALLASCFVEQTLLIKAHCFISQGLSEAPAIPLSLVLQTSFICPQTFWATFLFFSSCRKAESDIVQLHFSPSLYNIFMGCPWTYLIPSPVCGRHPRWQLYFRERASAWLF